MVLTRSQRSAIPAPIPFGPASILYSTSLLDMPSVIMEIIFDRLSIVDVMSFSMVTPQFANIVRSCRIKNKDDVIVEFDKNEVAIVIQDLSAVHDHRNVLRIRTDSKNKSSKSLVYSSECQRLETKKREFEYKGPPVPETVLQVHFQPKHANQAVKSMIDHFCLVLRKPITKVTMDVHRVPQFSKLCIWDCLKGSCEDLTLFGETMEHSEFIKLLRKVKVSKNLMVDVTCIKNLPQHLPYRFSKIQHLEFVQMNAPWMEDRHLLKLNARYIHLMDVRSKITSQGINQFLKRWLASDEKTFKALRVDGECNVGSEEVFKGMKTNRKRPPMRMGSRWLGDSTNSITRKDGATATFKSEYRNGYIICMDYP